MVRVAPIRLAFNPRTLWFDPRDLDIHNGDDVVVLTARGVEFGHAAGDVFEIDEEQVKKLKSPLKPVKRIATPEDVERAAAQIRRRARPSRASSPRSARQNIKSRSAPKRRGKASRSRVLALARSPRVFARSLKSRHRLRGRVNRERAVSVLRRAALPRKTSIVARAGARTRPAAARKTKAKESKCPSTTRF